MNVHIYGIWWENEVIRSNTLWDKLS